MPPFNPDAIRAWKDLLELLLILIALPWVLYELFTRPRHAMRKRAENV